MYVPISGQVTGPEESANVAQVAESNSYGGFTFTFRFEREFASYMGARDCIVVNSGSSANLLALVALELPKGSEVITSAVGFPTTVNPIIQLGHTPVFVDCDPATLTPIWDYAEWDTIAAGIVAHPLGNVAAIPAQVPFVEDCCDAIGSTIDGRMVGRKGVAATASFYPAHHITMGEGGAVLTDSPRLAKIIRSYRDWGRDCWCDPGKDNTCGRRFKGDYDHKYTYSRIGYNLKASDFQAAVGVAQLQKLDGFNRQRQYNWTYLFEALRELPIEIVRPSPGSVPSWFGFAFLTDRRNELARYLDANGIGNRPIMAGNLLRQPAYKGIECKVIGELKGANKIHEQGIWVGCFPGITPLMLEYMIERIRAFYG